MRIGVDVRSLMQKKYSGVSWYTLNLLKALLAIDKENEYLLFYNSSKRVAMPQLDADNAGYYGFHYPNKIFNLAVEFFDYPKIDKLIGGVDVFWTPNLHFTALSGDCKKILTVHDLSFLRFPEFFTWRSRLRHQLLMSKKIIHQSEIIVTDSVSTKRDLVELMGLAPQKIKVIYLGTDLEPASEAEKARVKAKYSLPEKIILYLGTLEPRKNVASIIRAFDLLKTDAELVVGGAAGWKTGEIYRLAAGNSKIKLLDYVPEADKAALYGLASCFIYPSYYEGFGLPLLEAMACGCPVIGGSNSSQVEVVGEDGLLVDPYNIREMATAIRSLLNDQGLRQEFIVRGLERAKEFTWQRTAEEFLINF